MIIDIILKRDPTYVYFIPPLGKNIYQEHSFKINLRNVDCYIIMKMVWMAINYDFSSNFCGTFLCSLPDGNLLFLFTNRICSINKISQNRTTFTHMSGLRFGLIRELLSSAWYKTLNGYVFRWKRKTVT